MSLAKRLISSIKNENTHLASEKNSASEFAGFIDTGCYIFNALMSGSIYGGLPDNKITALAGETSTGKTFFALHSVKLFLQDYKDSIVVYYDSESAVTSDMMKDRGIDPSRVIIVDVDTIEMFRTHAKKIIDEYAIAKKEDPNTPRIMIILDSLGNMSSKKEIEDITDGKDTRDMTKAQLIKGTFRVLTIACAQNKIPMIVTNHVYDVIGNMYPEKTMGGGSGLKYTSSQVVFFSKSKDKDGTEVVGNFIRCTLKKSRFTKENSQIICKLSYESGLDRYFGLLDLAEEGGIIKKNGNRYEINGGKFYAKAIYAEPEKFFTKDLLDKIDAYAGKKFKYGENDTTVLVDEEIIEI